MMENEKKPSNGGDDGARKERLRFVTRATHNLRAPLSASISMLELLRDQHLGPLNSNQAEYLRRIDRRCRTLLSMINDIMTLSTTRTVRQTVERQPLDGGWLAGRLQRTFHDKAAEKKIAFSVQVAQDLPKIRANSDMVEQILENLVSNAIKYTPDGGGVAVNFFKAEMAMVGIDIRDTGIGIPQDAMADLFSEFFRAPNARAMDESGTGLGLAIVKEFVTLQKGDISAESQLGKGTTFHLLLPVSPDESCDLP